MSTSPSFTLTNRVSYNTSSLYVPPELLGEIFTHCDAPTLAVVSRVSFACLELTSKLLYTNITLSDTKSIAMLLKLEPTSRSETSLSTRVTPHTSLSLIHSFTLHVDEGRVNVRALGAYKPEALPAPLPLEVLAFSVPTPRTDLDLGAPSARVVLGRFHTRDIEHLTCLFDPRTFVVRGRQPPLPTPETNPVHTFLWKGPTWTRLSVVILSGAVLDYGRRGRFPYAGTFSRPVRVVVDLLDFEEDPDEEIGTSKAATELDRNVLTVGLTRADEILAVWVGTEAMQDNLIAARKKRSRASDPIMVVTVPSTRVQRLRDAIVEHGVRKDMDWDALDDL